MEQERKNEEYSEAEAKRYGGYSSRLQYEKAKEKRRHGWLLFLQIAFFVVFLAMVGVCIDAATGAFSSSSGEQSGGESGGTVKVPTQSDLAQIVQDPEDMLEEVEYSLITVELQAPDGSRQYGTGFVISDQGHALCSSSLVSDAFSGELRAYTADGLSYAVTLVETVEELGFSLLHLEDAFGMMTLSVGNFSFVERGETLYAVGSVYGREYYGTALSGIAASVGKTVQVTVHGKAVFVPVVFLDAQTNASLYGGPVVDVSGNAVAFCTHTVSSPYGDLVSAVSINVILSLVNDILGES